MPSSDAVQVAVRQIIQSVNGVVRVASIFVAGIISLQLHENFDASLDVIQDSETVKLEEAISLFLELFLSKPLDFVIGPNLDLKVKINDSFMQYLVRRCRVHVGALFVLGIVLV